MKTLIVCNEKGEYVLTLTDVNDKYSCSITDIDDNREIIGLDLEANKIITVPSDISDYRKQQKTNELVTKNEAYSNKVELEQVKAENEELNGTLKEDIERLKSANTEILDYINVVAESK